MATRLTGKKLIERVDAALRSSFRGATIELESYDNTRVTGEIAWSGFSPGDAHANQRKLSAALKEKLGKDAERVICLFTATPLQKKLMDESRLAEEESILATAKKILPERRRKVRTKGSNGTNGHQPASAKKRKLTTHG